MLKKKPKEILIVKFKKSKEGEQNYTKTFYSVDHKHLTLTQLPKDFQHVGISQFITTHVIKRQRNK